MSESDHEQDAEKVMLPMVRQAHHED